MLVLTDCDEEASASALADHLLVHGISGNKNPVVTYRQLR